MYQDCKCIRFCLCTLCQVFHFRREASRSGSTRISLRVYRGQWTGRRSFQHQRSRKRFFVSMKQFCVSPFLPFEIGCQWRIMKTFLWETATPSFEGRLIWSHVGFTRKGECKLAALSVNGYRTVKKAGLPFRFSLFFVCLFVWIQQRAVGSRGESDRGMRCDWPTKGNTSVHGLARRSGDAWLPYSRATQALPKPLTCLYARS